MIQDRADADAAANLHRAERLIREAAGRGAQIICLKELFNAPYFCKAQHSERFDLAEPLPGKTTDALQALARELAVVLVVPVFERQGAGVYRNSAAVIDADGSLLGVYRKMHIPDDPLFNEKYYFAPGDTSPREQDKACTARGFKVWKTRYATIGVLICWDQWYPEAARITSLLGAQVLFYPTAIGWHPDEKDEWGAAQVDAWRTTQRAHAISNGVYVASPNRIGHEDEAGTNGITFSTSGRVVGVAPASGVTVHPIWFFGSEFMKCTEIEAVKTYRTSGAEKADPLNRYSTVGWVMEGFAALITDQNEGGCIEVATLN